MLEVTHYLQGSFKSFQCNISVRNSCLLSLCDLCCDLCAERINMTSFSFEHECFRYPVHTPSPRLNSSNQLLIHKATAIVSMISHGVYGDDLHLMNARGSFFVELHPRQETLRQALVNDEHHFGRNLRSQEHSLFIELPLREVSRSTCNLDTRR